MEKRRKLNEKHLVVEISIIGAIILGIVLWRFLPWFFVQPLPEPSDPYIEYKSLYNRVMDYDFEKGASADLEKRLDHAVDNYLDSFALYYNLKARIEYYHRLGGNDAKVIEDLERARDYAPTQDEEVYIMDLYQEITKTP